MNNLSMEGITDKSKAQNLIIVEGATDKCFIEKYIEYLVNKENLYLIKVDEPISLDTEIDCLSGVDQLKKKLKDTKFYKYVKIGIILDADTGFSDRLDMLNKVFND